MWRGGGFERFEVDRPRCGLLDERHAHAPPFRKARQRQERRIDGCEREDLGIGVGEQPCREGQSRHHARGAHDALGIDPPSVPPLEMRGEPLCKPRRLMRVAEHPVIDAIVDRREHLGRRGKIHVGHPHGQHVAIGVAIPFFRTGAVAIGAVGKQRILR